MPTADCLCCSLLVAQAHINNTQFKPLKWPIFELSSPPSYRSVAMTTIEERPQSKFLYYELKAFIYLFQQFDSDSSPPNRLDKTIGSGYPGKLESDA